MTTVHDDASSRPRSRLGSLTATIMLGALTVALFAAAVFGPQSSSAMAGAFGLFLGIACGMTWLARWEGTRKRSRGQKLGAWLGVVGILAAALVTLPLAHEGVIAARSAQHVLPATGPAVIDDGVYSATRLGGATLDYDDRYGVTTLTVTLTDTEDAVPTVGAVVRTPDGGQLRCRTEKRWSTYGEDIRVALTCDPGWTARQVRAASTVAIVRGT